MRAQLKAATYGPDVGRSVYRLGRMDPESGEILNHRFSRDQFNRLLGNGERGRVALEACSGLTGGHVASGTSHPASTPDMCTALSRPAGQLSDADSWAAGLSDSRWWRRKPQRLERRVVHRHGLPEVQLRLPDTVQVVLGRRAREAPTVVAISRWLRSHTKRWRSTSLSRSMGNLSFVCRLPDQIVERPVFICASDRGSYAGAVSAPGSEMWCP
jgi:hypothetical protein